MTRKELLQPLLEGTGETSYHVFDDWELVPGYIDGEHAATAVLHGTEIHFAVVPTFRRRAVTRRRAQEFLAPLLERLGFLTTRVQIKSTANQRFVERLGFKPTWTDGHFQYYLLGHLPFARS